MFLFQSQFVCLACLQPVCGDYVQTQVISQLDEPVDEIQIIVLDILNSTTGESLVTENSTVTDEVKIETRVCEPGNVIS